MVLESSPETCARVALALMAPSGIMLLGAWTLSQFALDPPFDAFEDPLRQAFGVFFYVLAAYAFALQLPETGRSYVRARRRLFG